MSDMTLIPTGGGEGSAAGAAGIGGLIGGGLGSLFGRGLGGFGGWGGDGGAVPVQNAIDTSAILTGINDLSTQAGQLGMTLIQGQNNIGMAVMQGQNSTNTTVERAAAQTYTGLTSQNTQNMLSNVQGFAGLNNTIQQSGFNTTQAINTASALATQQAFEAQRQAAACCCETNLNIERQGNATRDLIRDQFATEQAVRICDLKSENQALRFQVSQGEQTAALVALINSKIPSPI